MPERAKVIILIVLLAWHGEAAAYIDPNSGGLLFQLLMPLFVIVVAFWRAVVDALRRALVALRTWLG